METIKNIRYHSIEQVNQILENNSSIGVQINMDFNGELSCDKHDNCYEEVKGLQIYEGLVNSNKLFILNVNNMSKRYNKESNLYKLLEIIAYLDKFPNIILSGLDAKDLFWIKNELEKEKKRIMIAPYINKKINFEDRPDFMLSYQGPWFASSIKEADIINLVNNGQRVILDWRRPNPRNLTSKMANIIRETEASDNLYIAASFPKKARQLAKNIFSNSKK